MPRPFSPGWRKANIKGAREMWKLMDRPVIPYAEGPATKERDKRVDS